MIIKIILTISIICNLILIKKIFIKRLRVKNFGSKIPTVGIDKIDKDFELEKVSEELSVPKEITLVKGMLSQEVDFKGITSDYETWIMSVIAKKSKKIFEFGTCSGKTTYLLAENSPADCKIQTITLSPKELNTIKHASKDNKIATRNVIEESIYDKFFFTGKECERKIEVIFQDSKELDISKLKKKFDLIFIDGGHGYSCIKNDSEKALEMIKENGIIFWHDYILYKKSTSDVVKYLSNLSKKFQIFHINRTHMCFFRNIDK